MGAFAGPNTVQTGLIVCVDAADLRSYPGSGTVWSDLSNNNNNGTLLNAPTYSNSNIGNLTFTAANSQYGTIPPIASLTTFTAEVWTNFTTLPTSGTLPTMFTDIYTGTVVNFSIGVVQSPPFITGGFYSGGWHTPAGFTPVTNTWYQFAVTYDGATVILYVNGIAFSALSYAGTPASSGAGMRIARRWDTADYINGSIPVVKLYNQALTAVQIAQNFNALRGRYGL